MVLAERRRNENEARSGMFLLSILIPILTTSLKEEYNRKMNPSKFPMKRYPNARSLKIGSIPGLIEPT
jgi:hypothetical protein